MKKLLALAAASALTLGAGQAAAATYGLASTSFGAVCVPGPSPSCATAVGSQTGVGTAVLDGDGTSATLTSILDVEANIVLFGVLPDLADIGVTVEYSGGTLVGNLFTYTTTTQTFTSCGPNPAGPTCGQIVLNSPTVTVAPGQILFDLSQGGYTFVGDAANNTSYTCETGCEVAPIPVPAAAWLFGSSLLGLVGFSRRRRITA